MNQTIHYGGLMLDCLSCRELARNMHPTVAATIPATDLCSHCLEKSLCGALHELGSLLVEIRAGIDAGRDVLPDDLIDQADSVLKAATVYSTRTPLSSPPREVTLDDLVERSEYLTQCLNDNPLAELVRDLLVFLTGSADRKREES